MLQMYSSLSKIQWYFYVPLLQICPLIKKTKMTLAFWDIISNSNHTEVTAALLFKPILSDVFNPTFSI